MESHSLEQISGESECCDISEISEILDSPELEGCDPELMVMAINHAKVKALGRAKNSSIRYPEYLDVAMSTIIEAIIKNDDLYDYKEQLAFISQRIDWRFLDLESKNKRHRKANERIALEKGNGQMNKVSFADFIEFNNAPGVKEKRVIIRNWMFKILGLDEKKVMNVLMHADGYSDDEIANEIDKKRVATKVARHRAMKILKSRSGELKKLLKEAGF